jgi:hypothetical protein
VTLAAPAASLSAPPDLQPLRREVFTKDRQVVDTSSDVWPVYASPDGGKRLYLDFRVLADSASSRSQGAVLDERSQHILRLYAAHRLESSKASTVLNVLSTVGRLLRWYPSHARRAGADPSVLRGRASTTVRWRVGRTANTLATCRRTSTSLQQSASRW